MFIGSSGYFAQRKVAIVSECMGLLVLLALQLIICHVDVAVLSKSTEVGTQVSSPV